MTRILGIAILWCFSIVGTVAVSVWIMNSYIRPEFQKVQQALQTIPAVSTQHPVSGLSGNQCMLKGTGCVKALVAVMNQDRAQDGEPALSLSWSQSRGTATCTGSLGHARAMAADGQIWHVSPSHPAESFPSDLCGVYMAGGENVGEAYTPDKWSGILQIYDEMMAEPHSPGCTGNHACNVLSTSYSRVGVGIVFQSGVVWLVEDFEG